MSSISAYMLFSSSKGNCAYINNNGEEFLVDAGVSERSIERALSSLGTSLRNIRCIFVTHEHSDHIAGLENIVRDHGTPVYAPYMSCFALRKMSPFLENVIPFDSGVTAPVCLRNTGVTPYRTPHDAEGSVCYRFDLGSEVFGLATDIGNVTPDVEACLKGCGSVVIESNYDVDMLRNGRYPYSLKKRIEGDYGHLSNTACASFVPRLVDGGAHSVVLAHLSRDNNTPEIAYGETSGSLAAAGMIICGANRPGDVSLAVAPPCGACRII